MHTNSRCSRLVSPALAPALSPALPGLVLSSLTFVISSLMKLAALWCLVQLIDDPAVRWAATAAGLWIASALLSSAASWLAHSAEADFTARLRRQIARHLTQLPASTLARQGDSHLRRLVSDDIAALHHMVAHLPSEVATFAVVPLVSMALLVTMAGPVALLALLPGAIAALYYLVFMPRVAARYGSKRMQIMEEVSSAVDDYIRGIRVNRLYGSQAGALAAYHDATQRFTQGIVSWVSHVATAAAIAVSLLQAIATFAIAYTVAYQQDTASLAAVLFFSLAIVTPSLRLGHGLDYVAAGRSAAGRIADLLHETPLPSGHTSQPTQDAAFEAINASLSINDHPLIEQLSYRFPSGKLTAITGPSGTGKTTLLRALAGLETLHAGCICLAQIDITQLDAHSRHQSVLLIPQGDAVLPASVRENLTLTAPNATEAQLLDALRQAHLNVDLETAATQLSGGEQQRVGLARAFLSPAPVILLDEPTSALDSLTATRLLATLRTLASHQNKTIIIVTHDPALAADADAQLELKSTAAQGANP